MMRLIAPLTVVEHKPDGKPSDTIFNKRLVLFIWYGDPDTNRMGIVLPVRPVSAIPKDPKPGHFYTTSDLDQRSLRYADAVQARMNAIRKSKILGSDPELECRTMAPIGYVPPTKYLEIDANIQKAVPVEFFGEEIKKLPDELSENIIGYLRDKYQEKTYTPAERIALYLDDAEQGAVNLQYWTKRKKAVLVKLWGKFDVKDIAEFFHTDPEVISKIMSNK